jgi:hypothetical protein
MIFSPTKIEHFLTEDGNFIEDKEGFLPFGIGMRRCPGDNTIKNRQCLLVWQFTSHHDFESINFMST